eukprot:Nitzschia sp. Nitz4//NODE_293_length_29386_cov_71.949235//18112//19537//NITZ4_additional_000037-RA//1//CDS//3329531833//6755//frame0
MRGSTGSGQRVKHLPESSPVQHRSGSNQRLRLPFSSSFLSADRFALQEFCVAHTTSTCLISYLFVYQNPVESNQSTMNSVWGFALLVALACVSVSYALDIEPRIVGGSDVATGRVPYFVSLVNASRAHQCGGTLIAGDMVLTAASCTTDGPLTSALVGFHDPTDTSYEEFVIIKTSVHPSYDSTTGSYDIAILQLDSSSTFSPIVVNSVSGFPGGVTEIMAVGYGTTNSSGVMAVPSAVQALDLLYISQSSCSALINFLKAEEYIQRQITSDMMCIASYQETGQCTGDEGGPMVYTGDSADSDLLVGVMASDRGCVKYQYPTMGTRTSAAYPFIESTVCSDSGSAPDYFGCTSKPSASPTAAPSPSPTVSPTAAPSPSPTVSPTVAPSPSPTPKPSASPTAVIDDTGSPTAMPTESPTE